MRLQGPMEADLIGRLHLYEKDEKSWKTQTKIKRIYKHLKK